MAKPKTSTWEKVRDFVGRHKLSLSGGLGAAAAAGVLGHHVLRKPTSPSGPINARLRRIAGKHGIHYLMPTKARVGGSPSLWERIKSNVLVGGAGKIVYTDENMKPLKPVKIPGVTVGALPGSVKSKGEVLHGGLPTGKKMKEAFRLASKIQAGGKMKEADPSLGFSKFMSKGQSVADIAKKHGLSVYQPTPTQIQKAVAKHQSGKTMKGRPAVWARKALGLSNIGKKVYPNSPEHASTEQKAAFLNDLQKATRKEFGRGFLVKPHSVAAQSGRFPTGKGRWGTQIRAYETKLKPEIDAFRKAKTSSTLSPDIRIRKEFGRKKGYTGIALSEIFKHPKKVRVEHRLRLEKGIGGTPVEHRVHLLGGKEAPKELAFPRYATTRRLTMEGLGQSSGTSADAAAWVQKHVVPSIPAKYKKGMYALDVARVKAGKGKFRWKIIELNPAVGEGTSGLLDPAISPHASHAIYKWVHGKPAPLNVAARTAAAGGAAAAAGGIATHLIGRRKKKEE